MRSATNTVSEEKTGRPAWLGNSEGRRDVIFGGRNSDFNEELAREVKEGFERDPKSISSRWFYDERGSRIFSLIMGLPEYYLTASETEILNTHGAEIASEIISGLTAGLTSGVSPAGRFSGRCRIVELGAGDGKKTEILLRELLRVSGSSDAESDSDSTLDAKSGAKPVEDPDSKVCFKTEIVYNPIDISPTALEDLCGRLKRELPKLACEPVVGDNLGALGELVGRLSDDEPVVVLFLGSSIGNFGRDEVLGFFRELRANLRPGDSVFTGFDLVKSPRRLVPAYSDSEGVTAEFNYNLLDRMNRELGADFDRALFRHEAVWNSGVAAMESWLVSVEDQVVSIPACGQSYRFRKGEAIHTETSLKFRREEISDIAERSGFAAVQQFTDSKGDFVDAFWRVEPVKM